MNSTPQIDPFAPCPAPFNLAAYVLDPGNAPSAKTALELWSGTRVDRWSYHRLRRAVFQTAAALLEEGCQPRDKILMRVGNSVDFPILFLACLAADLVPVPTSAALTQEEIDWIAGDLQPALSVWDGETVAPTGLRSLRIHDIKSAEQIAGFEPVPGDPNRLAFVVYTSGSSGRPRAVAHAHRAIWARRMMWDGWYGMGPEDRMLHAGAFNWTYTLGVGLMDPWAIGATAIIPAAGTQSVDLPELLHQSEASIFAAAPGVYRQILKSDALTPLPSLRHGLAAGEALPGSLRETWRDRMGTEIYEALGMSECSTFVSGCPTRPAPPGTAGYAQPGRRIAALGAEGAPVPPLKPGRLAIHRSDPGLMLGYLEDGRPTLPLQGDWFDTGDMVEIGADGAVRYLGRDDDMMNAGGFRVSPLEVERAFQSLPEITETAAVEVEIKPDVTVIALFYASNTALPEDRLRAEALQHLARYKQPRLYIHRETLPKGGNGKLNRRALRAGFEAPHDQA
ncbi:class I adenylate-forming enzyme family protein [Dinoroseobacter sp. S76]|uniref:class I adenylate-forming enzyme family protein n=1 Tax=Dinoroseobacter sp. S76 TaxID=3415124 RepID=UPI003C79CC97